MARSPMTENSTRGLDTAAALTETGADPAGQAGWSSHMHTHVQQGTLQQPGWDTRAADP